jgi:phosphoribosylamine-glycine ligase
MKIGIYDDYFVSLQRRLLMEGHTLYVYVEDTPKLSAKQFNITGAQGNLHQVMSLMDLVNAKCDLYIVGTHHDSLPYEVITTLLPNTPVLGYASEVTLLELNRSFAFRMNEILGVTDLIKNPTEHRFTDIDDLRAFIKSAKSSWVLKQSEQSPLSEYDNRTIVFGPRDAEPMLSMLEAGNPFFRKTDTDFYGGAIVQQFIQGNEVCFGRWFNGSNFVGPTYTCQEHKGAQNGNRGGLLTGEVGTSLTWNATTKGKLALLWDRLESFLRGKCRGMIDVNCILTPTGKLYFIEYTIRFGRPTLELQLACLPPVDKFNLGQSLKADNAFNHVNQYSHACGVTVFSYGIPIVRAKSGEQFKPQKIQMPTTSPGFDVQPLFCQYSMEKKAWVTRQYERQFTAIGLSADSFTMAQKRVYHCLHNYQLMNHTWRDDIGDNHQTVLKELAKHGIIT